MRLDSGSPELRRLGLVGALLAWCAALILVRVFRSFSLAYAFLVWNLFLAAIPLGASSLLRLGDGRLPRLARAGCFALWLLFLPNAPYVLTDLIHLHSRPGVPLWYDLALLLSCAGTGLLLGYLSLQDVQAVVERQAGQAAGWAVALGSLLLSGLGIYVGRFLRWNSWEVLTDPGKLLGGLGEHLGDPALLFRMGGVTLVWGIGLGLGYLALGLLAERLPVGNDDGLRTS